ncbi:MAG: double zinc ribbon domain-containing protein [Patescibacteria group bacterium]|nr:double zinc ribbon domain-containing protein [Patescibacteria group bacterium]
MGLYFNKIFSRAAHGRDFILDIIFPVSCINCEAEGRWLCRACSRKLQFSSSQYCLNCKKQNIYGEFCDNCSAYYSLNGVWIAGDYEDKILSELIKTLKYKFVNAIAGILGDYAAIFLANLIKINSNSSINFIHPLKHGSPAPNIFSNFSHSLIVPVPLHKQRLKWRGFNQAQKIAEIVANKLNLEIDSSNLIRIKRAKPQAKINAAQRKKNIINCFQWQGKNLNQKNIILFDDVATTGSTLNECARILKNAGAKEIWGLAIAKG